MMSGQANLNVVQTLYAAFGRGDMPTILSTLADDVDWLFVGQASDVPWAGHRHGHQEITEFFGIVAHLCDVLQWGPHEMHAFDDKVVALGAEEVRAKPTGKTFQTEWAHMFTLHDGKITRVREYYDTAAMAAAFRPD